jgi:hypothetical protein
MPLSTKPFSNSRQHRSGTDGNVLYSYLSGTTPVTNQIVAGIDEFFSTKSGATYSPITDGLGSVLALTNSSGATAETVRLLRHMRFSLAFTVRRRLRIRTLLHGLHYR